MRCGFGPCYLVGDLSRMKLNLGHRSSAVVGYGLCCMLILSISATAQAQTYYYYPSSAPADATAAPTYYYQTQPSQAGYVTQYYQQAPAVQYYYPAQYATQTPQYTYEAQSSGDPYGFTQWLNGVRASYGLPAVGYDANLESWAAANNSQQSVRGMGHYVMGSARRQNSAMGAFSNIGAMWMNSPAHRAALLDPTIRAIGIAGLGAYWTFNAY